MTKLVTYVIWAVLLLGILVVWLFSSPGIDQLQKEINDLKSQNIQLEAVASERQEKISKQLEQIKGLKDKNVLLDQERDTAWLAYSRLNKERDKLYATDLQDIKELSDSLLLIGILNELLGSE